MRCGCARQKAECNDACGCYCRKNQASKCNNRQMALKQRLVLGKDVVEKIAWGVDLCTQVNFVDVLPREVSNVIVDGWHINRQVLIAKKLNFAIQQQGEFGYDIKRALRYIINADLSDAILGKKYTAED